MSKRKYHRIDRHMKFKAKYLRKKYRVLNISTNEKNISVYYTGNTFE